MVQTTAQTIKVLKQFKKKLNKEFKVERMLLYGSRARGDALKHSDIDLIVISLKFQKIHFLERIISISKKWEGETPLEVFCYTPAEFDNKKNESLYFQHMLKEAIEI